MKKIICLIILLTGLSITAQETITVPLEDNVPEHIPGQIVYSKDINNVLDKFLGEWVYDNGTDYVKLTITKAIHVPYARNKMYQDELSCKFLYKKNGVTIYDTYNSSDEYLSGVGFYFDLEAGAVNTNQYNMVYSEPTINGGCYRTRGADLVLSYSLPNGSNPAELDWVRTYNKNMNVSSSVGCQDGTEPDSSDFKIPSNMTLVKQ